ncbi:hypothetical protein ACPEEZ_13910 [Frigoribacterium sp. 2-23]|uniref:hypothetical protein n=1 Tax=Frigoribacterium sp. 2-23 TaxID=3415006 RepID=UPI003C6EFACE
MAIADTSWSFPAVGETGQIRSADGSCLYANTNSDTRIRYAPCAAVPPTSESSWTVQPDGRVESASYVMTNRSSGTYLFLGRSDKAKAGLRLVGPHTGLGLTGVTAASSSFDAAGVLTLSGTATPGSQIRAGGETAVVQGSGRSGTWTLRLPDAPGQIEVQQWVSTPSAGWQRYDTTTVDIGMTAQLVSVDEQSRSATVTGTARPGSTVAVDDARLDIGAEGTFSYTAHGLVLGSNTIRFDETVRGTVRSSATVEAVIDVAALTAHSRFEAAAGAPVTLFGQGNPGAMVEVMAGPATVVASATVDAATGAWSTSLPAPGAGGVYSVRVHQMVDGESKGDLQLDIDYGSPVAISSPSHGSIVGAGPVHLEGTGLAGSSITVGEKGSAGMLGSATVTGNGTWALTTSSLEKREYVLVATQLGRGANTTTHSITVNPGEAPTPFVDAAVTSPDGFVAGWVNRVSGTATPGATMTITNPWGTPIARHVAVDTFGNWTFERAFSGESTIRLHFTQTLPDGRSKTTGPVDFPPAPKAFRVMSPAPSDGFVPNTVVTFSGTAEPGSTIGMTNKWGVVLAKPVITDEKGRWSIARKMTGTSTYHIDFTETDHGTSTTVKFYGFAPRG